MPQFAYKAITQKGKTVSGKITANNSLEAKDALKEKNLYPLEVLEASQKDDVSAILARYTRIKSKDFSFFCRQFYAMTNAGIPITQTLDIIQQQTQKLKFRKIIFDVNEQLQKGYTFSEALKQNADIFPPIMINLVEAGEVSGNLDEIMDRLSTHFDKENKIQNKIKAAMIYPIVLLLVTIVVVVFLLTVVMPTFLGMFQGSGTPLPGPTRLLLAMSDALRNQWYLFIAGILLILLIWTLLNKNEKFRIFNAKTKLKRIPVIRGMNLMLVTSRFARTMSILSRSGVEMLTSIEITGRVIGNEFVAVKLFQVSEDVKKGVNISSPLKRYDIFPPMLSAMVKIGEDSGSLDDILDKTATFYEEELEAAIQRVMALIEPGMILIMGVIVGFIVIAMLMPMFDMVTTIR